MATAAEIRQRIYDYVYGAYPKDRPFETQITSSYLIGATTINVIDGTDWAEGDVVENTVQGDQMLVLSVAANALTVERSYNNTTAAASSGAADRLRKNPRFSQQMVDNATTEALNILEAWGVHAFGTGSVTLAASQFYFEASETDISEVYGILSVYYDDTTTQIPIALPFIWRQHLSTGPAAWSQGRGIHLQSKGDRATTATIYYTYAKLIDAVADLLVSQEELVVVGAVARLLGHTITPATQDPGSRTDRTTPPGQTSRDGRWFQGEFFIKARAEAARLTVIRQQFPGDARTRRARRWRA